MSSTRVQVADAAPPGATGLVPRRELFALLDRALSGRVTVVSAPPGSGKTFLLRSWLEQAEPGLRVAWVSLERGESDAQRFWLSVVGGLDEARELLDAAGIELSEAALATLHERTEGWVAGLRLAAIALAEHPDPEQFVAQFSGSERTVADYLLAEMLDRQPADVRNLLLRTSVLERVNGPLADLLTGGTGSERILQNLEEGNSFVAALDAGRSWFRYHHLFADLLRLELRRTDPGRVSELHQAAARWYAEHAEIVDAVRHAQAAGDWPQAGRLLAEHMPGLLLEGEG